MRRSRLCAVTLPRPSTGQPRKSEPQDHRLPSEARMSPWLWPRPMAGVSWPTGNFSRPWPRFHVGDHVTKMPAASKITAPATNAILNFRRAMNRSVAPRCDCVEVEGIGVRWLMARMIKSSQRRRSGAPTRFQKRPIRYYLLDIRHRTYSCAMTKQHRGLPPDGIVLAVECRQSERSSQPSRPP